MLDLAYVLPVRWNDVRAAAEMTEYLRWLTGRVAVIVVDGSPPEVFEQHAELWGSLVEHIRPDSDLGFINGKVNAVTTGIRAAGSDNVIVADDDIRFDHASLHPVAALLADHDLVIIQSFYEPTPWRACWDEARVLVNRAFGVHFPAALGLRRSLFLDIGGYDGDVLFENLELIRSMRFGGARVAAPGDLFVRHLAPVRAAFWSQRVRQAYDDFALPGRMMIWLSLGPLAAFALGRKRAGSIVLAGLAAIGPAEVGRRRSGGTRVYPVTASLLAPLWLAERAVCSWIAVWYRVHRGGVPYRDGVISCAATPAGELRARIAQRTARHSREP